jgi:hypothetical protein
MRALTAAHTENNSNEETALNSILEADFVIPTVSDLRKGHNTEGSPKQLMCKHHKVRERHRPEKDHDITIRPASREFVKGQKYDSMYARENMIMCDEGI